MDWAQLNLKKQYRHQAPEEPAHFRCCYLVGGLLHLSRPEVGRLKNKYNVFFGFGRTLSALSKRGLGADCKGQDCENNGSHEDPSRLALPFWHRNLIRVADNARGRTLNLANAPLQAIVYTRKPNRQ